MNKQVTVTINGRQIQAREGQTILEVATAAGIDIPTLCHHPALAPIGACRLCVVEISRFQPLHPACTYTVTDGLAVETHSERVEKVRRFVLDLLFSERNHYCMFCERSGQCELQDLGYRYGIDHWRYPTYTGRYPVDATRATFLMDHNRCVLCRRCVRACAELVANHTLGLRQRGAHTMISADLDVPFGDSSCVECGTCLQVCPTGALLDKRSAFVDTGHGVALERVKTICTQCSVGCGLDVVMRDGQIVRIEGDWDAAPNYGILCHKGRFDPLRDRRPRLSRPLVRRDGKLEPAGWDEALDVAAGRLEATGSRASAFLASASATSEALALVERLAHDDGNDARVGLLGPTLARLPVPHAALDRIAASDLILVAGADPVEDQPVVSFLIKRAVDRGARLVVVDGAANGLGPFAHHCFDADHLDDALELATRADAPVVLYGSRLDGIAAAQLPNLERAAFVALEPGTNSAAAAEHGFQAGLNGSNPVALVVLQGEDPLAGPAAIPDTGFLVVLAAHESPLLDRADVILPTAAWSERGGAFTNLEGRAVQAYPVVAAHGEAKADWEILALLAERLTTFQDARKRLPEGDLRSAGRR